MASRLWLLVSLWLPQAHDGKCHDCRRSCKIEQWVPEVLKGSHHLGRWIIPWLRVVWHWSRTSKVALEQYEKVDWIRTGGHFFHCNLLHCSGQNHSPQPRWAMICCYNAASNNPYKILDIPIYTSRASGWHSCQNGWAEKIQWKWRCWF